MSLPQSYSASYFGVSMIAIIWPSPVSNLTTTNKVDTDVKNDDDSQSFANPRNTITVPINCVVKLLQLTRLILIQIRVYANRVLQIKRHP